MKIATILTLPSVIFASVLFCLMITLVPAVAQRNNVHIPDRNLRAAIVSSLYNKKSGDTISQADMRTLTVLRMRKLGIEDLTGLEFATNLKKLRLDYNQISDVSPLAELTKLIDLDLNVNQISDISPLAGLTNLTGLSLGSNQISDISPLAGLTNLTGLGLSSNQISDISPLARLTNLTGLYLTKNQVSDISPLAGLTNLKFLYLDRNQISDFSPIAGLIPKLGIYTNERQTVSKGSSFRIPDSSLGVAIRKSLGKRTGATISQADMRRLTVLRAYNRSIKNLTGLEFATNLKKLRLASNQISDISPLSKLTKLTELHLGSNLISDISPLSGLRNLKWLHLGDNQISDFSPIARLVPNLRVYVNANQTVSKGSSVYIPDSSLRAAIERALGKRSGAMITPLDMRKLTIFRARRQGIENLTGLEYATNLKKLYFIGNRISDISALASLTKLTELELNFNQVSDISPLSGLTNLKFLYLDRNRISDFSPIAGLIPNLKFYRNANQTVPKGDSVHIPDSKLRVAIETEMGKTSGATINRTDMRRLTVLRAYNRSIKNLTGLEYASNLKKLRLASNQISDISLLSRLTLLTELELNSNLISDISPLSGLTNLKWLHLGDNQISDFSPLLQLPNLGFLITDDGKFTSRRDVITYLRRSSFITLSRRKVTTLAYSPDSRTLASASRDGTIRLSNAASGRRKTTLKGHIGDVNSVAYSPDGNTLATCGDDKTVRLWHAVTGRHKTTLKGHTGIVSKVAFSPDGEILASASFDGTVRLWRVDTGQHITTLKGHAGRVLDVAFRPSGEILATGSSDKTVRIWKSTTKKETWFNPYTLTGHTSEVWGVAFSPGGTTLASASFDGTVRLWDITQKRVPHIITLKGHTDGVIDVAYSPDGRILASGSSDKTVRLWDPFSGHHLTTLKGHAAHVGSLAFSPDGKYLAEASQGNEVRLYDLNYLRDSLLDQPIDTAPVFCLTVDDLSKRIPTPKSLQDEDAPLIARGYLGGSTGRSVKWTQKDTVYDEKATDEIVLTVRFKGGGSNQRAIVKKYARVWSDNSGVRFLFPPEIAEWGESDIIVGFIEGLGSWSHLGWWCREIARTGEPTMNLDWSLDSQYCGGMPVTIMHEFGHALGLVHEHQSPATEIDLYPVIHAATLQFNKEHEKTRWSSKEAYASALERRLANYKPYYFGREFSNFTEFDPESIMLYSGLLLKNGAVTPCNTELSETDRLFIGGVYPKPAPSSITVSGIRDGQTVDTGSEFNVKSSSLNVSVTVHTSDGAKLPKRSVKLSAETGKYSYVSIEPNIILTGAAGEAATTRIFLQGADEHVTIHVEVPGTKLKNSYKVFVRGVTTEYQRDFDFKVHAKLNLNLDSDKRDWERSFTVYDPEWGDSHWMWKAKITGYSVEGGRGEYGCLILFVDCGDAGVYEDQTTYSGDTITIRGWLEDGFPIYADAHAHGTIKYKVIRSEPNWEEISYSIPQETVVTLAPSANQRVVDVNGDGHVDTVDLLLVSNYIGQTGSIDPRVDVNDDGVVTIADLVQVAQYLGQSVYSSAPAQVVVPKGLTYGTVEEWIASARAADDGSLVFRQGIEKLEYLLTVIIPEKTALLHNYPNPFNPETWIPYHLSEPAKVVLTIYSIDGKVVRHLDLRHQPAGYYQNKSRAAYWDGRNNVGERVASGIYFYTITAGEFTATRKLLIRK